MNAWDLKNEPPKLDYARVGDVVLKPGDRVLLRPLRRADILDLALAGKAATIASIEQDFEGRIYLAVTLDDDPGRDLGLAKQPGHRFFFGIEEVELLSQRAAHEESGRDPAYSVRGSFTPMKPRILIAGIGNIFLGDDAFGVEVVRRLAARPLPEGIKVVDFGIRGLDLTYALLEPYDAVILVDAAPRGGVPGTLYVLELEARDSAEQLTLPAELHSLDPVKVLRLARSMGGAIDKIFLVACEPQLPEGDGDFQMAMSPAVHTAAEEAVILIDALIANLRSSPQNSAGVSACMSFRLP